MAAEGRISVASFDRPSPMQLVHTFLLAAAVPLFLGGLLSDVAYARTYEIQWSNFAAWLIAGAMVFTGFGLLWSLLGLLRSPSRRLLVSALLLLAAFILGLINSFVHAQDAWAVMPEGLVLSFVVVALAAAATWLGFATLRLGAPQ